MKKTALALCLIGSLLQADLSVERVHDMVIKIQGKRTSPIKIDFEKVPSPFVSIVEPKDENETVVVKPLTNEAKFYLKAIVNDQAMINGKWVKKGDMVSSGYTVDSVEGDTVVLGKDGKTLKLQLYTNKHPFFEIKNKE